MTYKVCSSCGKHVRESEPRCWNCQSVEFLTDGTPAAVPEIDRPTPVALAGDDLQKESATKKCPFCAEDIQQAAIVCKHCGRDLKTGATPPTQAEVAKTEANKKAGWGCLIIVIFVVVVALADQCNPSSPPSSSGSSSAPSPRAATNVRKKDGTFDQRENDLNILCEDWRFYRGRILSATAAGDEKAAAAARQSFQRINGWLNAYPDNDVAEACGSRE